MRKLIVFLAILLLFGGIDQDSAATVKGDTLDRHVHIMSPGLVKYWKSAGVPFSKEEKFYSDLKTISENLGTKRFFAVSMAHTWNHPEFGKIRNEAEEVRKENDFVLDSVKAFGSGVKPFCSVNPMRDFALEEVKRCKKRGAFGLKLHHNANQIYLTEPEHIRKILPVWEYAAKKKLRILLHFDNSHRKFGAPDIGIFFDEILSKLEPTKIQIAHLGGSGGFSDKVKRIQRAFQNEFSKASIHNRKHRIVFDLSAVALDKNSQGVSKLSDKEFAELAALIRETGLQYFVFGTDYPLYTTEQYKDILLNKVGLTEAEMKIILRKKL